MEYQIHETPVKTPAGIAVKLRLWARSHCPPEETPGGWQECAENWHKAPVEEFVGDLDNMPIIGALRDLERLAAESYTETGAWSNDPSPAPAGLLFAPC